MISREKHDRMANAIRFLSMDAVEKANSGHPGLPMGAADIATVLFTRFLSFDPKTPSWPNRDRFVLSAGHGSMLLYSLLYLTATRTSRSTRSRIVPPAAARAPPATRNTATPPASRRPPVRSARASPTPSAWRSPRSKLRDEFGSRSASNTTPMCIVGDGCLMEGISQEATLARRPPEAQQADRVLGRQQHLDRRPDLDCRLDRPARPLPRLALAHDRRRRPRSGGDCRGDRGSPEVRQADPDRLQDDHRLRRAEQGRHAQGAWFAARCGRKSPPPARR
jgi:hypothetical protein